MTYIDVPAIANVLYHIVFLVFLFGISGNLAKIINNISQVVREMVSTREQIQAINKAVGGDASEFETTKAPPRYEYMTLMRDMSHEHSLTEVIHEINSKHAPNGWQVAGFDTLLRQYPGGTVMVLVFILEREKSFFSDIPVIGNKRPRREPDPELKTQEYLGD